MKDQLLDTWQINYRMNLLLMDNMTDAGMQKSLSKRGGRTVDLQWVDVHHVRIQWLEICAKDIFSAHGAQWAGSGGKKYKVLDKEKVFDRKALRKAFEDSAKGIEELLARSWDDGGNVKEFSPGPRGKKGVIPLLGYFISNESHHRGNILLTLKESVEKIPDAVKCGLWEWGK